MTRGACALLVWLCSPVPVLAEMDAEQYQSREGAPTAEERERLRAEIAAEREAARRREAAEQAEREAARQRRQAIEAAQPAGRRLYERRCLGCHAPEALAQTRHTRPGWYLTIARMRWLNGAAVSGKEARVISGYLTKQQPLEGWQRPGEYGLIALLPLGLAGVGYGGYRWYRRRVNRHRAATTST
ncbi:hypothetical protein [Thiohalophilus sp.]|uniref:hypothetical protein n=1 Tax=Thiohalophilus sp. TaxID=3028392 RepID=UPI002ACDF557|nr:hypothetical protein [Thiohalophilus sp.]MDZ7663334.1 hypothetical protein [Thiohalophilus sp.]